MAFAVLKNVVADVCNKKMVLLGEDAHHGSDKTIEIKVELIKRLIDECEFSAVFFESSVYEFINLDGSVLSQSSSAKQIAESIGGIWSTTKPMSSLISYLHKITKSQNHKITKSQNHKINKSATLQR